MTPCFKTTMPIALFTAVFLFVLSAHACNDWTARDEAFWKEMRDEPRDFLFPLSPLSLSGRYGIAGELNDKGVGAFRGGDYPSSLKYYAEALKTNPGLAAVHHNLALIFFARLEFERAIESWRRAAVLEPASPRYHFHIAFALSSGGKAEEAIREYRALLRMMGPRLEIYRAVGRLYEFKGVRGRPEQNFKRALALRPDDVPTLNDLAGLYKRTGRLSAAGRIYRKLIKVRPGDADNYLNLGSVYLAMGYKDLAVRYYRKASGLRGDYPEPHLLLSRVYREIGRPGDASKEEDLARSISCDLRPGM